MHTSFNISGLYMQDIRTKSLKFVPKAANGGRKEDWLQRTVTQMRGEFKNLVVGARTLGHTLATPNDPVDGDVGMARPRASDRRS